MAENDQTVYDSNGGKKNISIPVFPNGITSAPRIFTKLMKPVYS
jgi:hypothetical protein